jgi:hypothetical protein
VGHGGEDVRPDENPASGSWNSFHEFRDLPDLAIRQPQPEVIGRKLLTGEISSEALQRRLAEELKIWHFLAAVKLAPMIYGVKARRHALGGKDIDLFTTLPEKFAMSVDKYLRQIQRREADLVLAAYQISALCFGVADLGYCHLDIKLGNLVLNTQPIDVRLIDFDPLYMRNIKGDERVVLQVAATLSSSVGQACNVVRLFYVLLMQTFVYLGAARRHRLASKKLPPEGALAANAGVLAGAVRRNVQRIRCPFSIFFTVPDLVSSELMRLAANRFYQYNLGDVKNRVAHLEPLQQAEARFARAHSLALEAVTAGEKPTGTSLAILKRERETQRALAAMPILRKEIAKAIGDKGGRDVLPAVAGRAFGTHSSGPSRRRYQSRDYAMVCGTGTGLLTLSPRDDPVEVPDLLSPETHDALKVQAREQRRAFLAAARAPGHAA